MDPETPNYTEKEYPLDRLVDDPKFYAEIPAPPRKGEYEPTTRKTHIWEEGHQEEFKAIGFNSFEQTLPSLIKIATNKNSLQAIDPHSGNTISVDPSEGIVVVTRETPFDYSNPPFKIPNQPPLPPIVVTAFVLEDPRNAKHYIKNITRR